MESFITGLLGSQVPMEVEEPHRSVLAATYHLKEGLELSDRDRDAPGRCCRPAGCQGRQHPGAYETARQGFQEWAGGAGHQALPAAPQAVALYLGRRAADGRAMATIEQARAGIPQALGAVALNPPRKLRAVRGLGGGPRLR
jgi:hypothetical protein